MKKILTTILAAALGLSSWGATVAKIGETGYETLQAAIDAAHDMLGDVTITLLADIKENVLVQQKTGLNLTIDGNNKACTVAGRIIVFGAAAGLNGADTLTITGLKFVYQSGGTSIPDISWNGRQGGQETASAFVYGVGYITPETSICGKTFTGANSYGLAHNVTVSNCSFDGTGSDLGIVAVKQPMQSAKNIVIRDCEAAHVHSLAQLTATTGITIENCTLSDAKNGINISGGDDNNPILIKDCDVTTNLTPEDPSYGIRIKDGNTSVATLDGNTVVSDQAIVVKGGAKSLTLDDGEYTGSISVGSGSLTVPSTSGTKVSGTLTTSGAGSISIAGGSYTKQPSAEMLTEGYVVSGTPNAQGYYTVVDPTAPVDPAVNTVVSANEFGALAITGNAATNAYVAVPFGAFGDGDASIAAADVVQAAALGEGDKMYVWNGAEGTQQKYEVYTVSGGAWTTANKVTVAADGSVTTGSVSADALPVPTGTGVFIERANTAKPIYVYGQVLTNTVAETTFAAGLTLVSAPALKAMGEIDLNTLTWTGVTALPTKTARGKTYPDWSKMAEADYLYFRNASGATIRCYYSDEKWVTENGVGSVKVPAGAAFWYYARTAGAKVVW